MQQMPPPPHTHTLVLFLNTHPTHLEQRPVCILLGHLKGEALDHCCLHLSHILQHLTLLDGHCLLVLGINQGLELNQTSVQLVQRSKACSLCVREWGGEKG
jgi:hypothetical protein